MSDILTKIKSTADILGGDVFFANAEGLDPENLNSPELLPNGMYIRLEGSDGSRAYISAYEIDRSISTIINLSKDKANQADVDALQALLESKASDTDIELLRSDLEGVATKTEVEAVAASLTGKADKTELANYVTNETYNAFDGSAACHDTLCLRKNRDSYNPR